MGHLPFLQSDDNARCRLVLEAIGDQFSEKHHGADYIGNLSKWRFACNVHVSLHQVKATKKKNVQRTGQMPKRLGMQGFC